MLKNNRATKQNIKSIETVANAPIINAIFSTAVNFCNSILVRMYFFIFSNMI
jgi:hypothetical protein